MSDDEFQSDEEDEKVSKRKAPEKKQKKEAPPSLERRKSSRLQQKPTKKYDDDEDKASDEDFTPSRSNSKGLKKKAPKTKKAKTEEDKDDAPEEVNTPSSKPPSQDGLSNLSTHYNDVQSQDFLLATYKRNQGYLQPLGKLTKEQVKEGKQVLDKLKSLMDEGETDEKKFIDLSNQFYTVIPSQNESLPPIKTKEELDDKYSQLQALE